MVISLASLKSRVPTVSPFAVKVMVPPLMVFPLSSVKVAFKLMVSPSSAFIVELFIKVRIVLMLPPSR